MSFSCLNSSRPLPWLSTPDQQRFTTLDFPALAEVYLACGGVTILLVLERFWPLFGMLCKVSDTALLHARKILGDANRFAKCILAPNTCTTSFEPFSDITSPISPITCLKAPASPLQSCCAFSSHGWSTCHSAISGRISCASSSGSKLSFRCRRCSACSFGLWQIQRVG